MVSVEYSEAIVEVLDILKHSEYDIINKIPKDLIKFWQENKSITYKPNLDHNKPIKDMNIKNKTRALISMIYLNYLCDETEKKELLLQLKNNEKELRKKYDIEDIFKRKSITTEVKLNEETNNVALVEHKETLFKKITNKLKKFFKHNTNNY